MTEIKINRLVLENFKCHRMLNIVLEGKSASIYGDNATGKTSVYDALTWLLFGKDSQGNGEKNIDIKPLDHDGNVKDHDAITSVEAEFSVNGETTTFRRTYREVWATRRGTGTPVYEGNTSDYFVNGVPMKKNAYDSAIKEMVSEDLFRMLTSVSHFAEGMRWQDRRAVLFDMTKALTDWEILGSNSQFAELSESIGKLTLAEYKSKLQHERKGLTGIRDDSPTRINECQRTLNDIADIDFAAAKAEEDELIRKRDGLQVQLMALEQDSVLDKKRLDLREAKMERDMLESRNRAHRATKSSSGPSVSNIQNEIHREMARIESTRGIIKAFQKTVDRLEMEVQNHRDEYVAVNGEAFTGGVCPTCNQPLPFEELQKATQKFNQVKEKKLAQIMQKADGLKAEQQQTKQRMDQMEADIKKMKKTVGDLEMQLEVAQKNTTVVDDLPEYADGIEQLNAKVEKIQNEICNIMADSAKVRDQIRRDLSAVNDQIRFVQGVIAKESIREQTEKRIRELKEDAKNAAEALENIEKMLYMMEEFTRFKAKYVESSINDLFRIASFRLFREQANGGLEERCDAQHDGVPYMGLNNGMKVNVGVDIINALSRHYGVSVPLFIDNAEAVTKLEKCNAQVIRLVVSEDDKELRIR